jgi:hypothetical protein
MFDAIMSDLASDFVVVVVAIIILTIIIIASKPLSNKCMSLL